MPIKKRRARNAIFWSLTIALGVVGVIVVVASVGERRDGSPVIEDPTAILGGAITAVSLVLSGALSILLRSERNSESIKESVLNGHKKPDGSPLGMRDDIDDKHDEIGAWIYGLRTEMGAQRNSSNYLKRLMEAQASDIRGLRRDVGRVADATGDLSGRVATIERAQDHITHRIGDLLDRATPPLDT